MTTAVAEYSPIEAGLADLRSRYAGVAAIEFEEAQRLMDALWQAGVRPTDGTGSTGQLAATQAHLADMRKLVFERWEPTMVRA